ncbi:PAS domain-containing protein, partial [Streptomyces sp. NPDC052535]|uniref:PAS domain-containing protein n=1 Tax=Streptomyces sp. NPDC052535 TaxID=3155531 RepID=UPI0034212F27
MEDSSATVIVDARGLVTGWSDGARRLTGYTAEEVVGRPARDLRARLLLRLLVGRRLRARVGVLLGAVAQVGELA